MTKVQIPMTMKKFALVFFTLVIGIWSLVLDAWSFED